MNAARRNAARRNWPRGLYEPRPDYYVWRHPDGTVIPIGRVTLQSAKTQANLANLKVEAGAATLLEKLEHRATAGNTVHNLLAKIPLSDNANTRRSHRSFDKRINAALGDRDPATLTTKDFAELIEPIETVEGKARTAEAVRSRCQVMCHRGMQLGWMSSDPVVATRSPEVKVMRRRLTLEAFMAVRAKAPQVYPWLEKAMDLALVTGCDRQTIAKLERRKHIVGDYLEFQRGKTQVRIAIPLDIELRCAGLRLRDVVKNTTNIASRFLVHHTISYPGTPAGSPVFVNTMTEAFRLAYNLTDLPKDNAPTFHEIRSLAKRLYMAQGNVDTKALLGHLSDQAGALYADPRGAEALRVAVAPLPPSKHEVNDK